MQPPPNVGGAGGGANHAANQLRLQQMQLFQLQQQGQLRQQNGQHGMLGSGDGSFGRLPQGLGLAGGAATNGSQQFGNQQWGGGDSSGLNAGLGLAGQQRNSFNVGSPALGGAAGLGMNQLGGGSGGLQQQLQQGGQSGGGGGGNASNQAAFLMMGGGGKNSGNASKVGMMNNPMLLGNQQGKGSAPSLAQMQLLHGSPSPGLDRQQQPSQRGGMNMFPGAGTPSPGSSNVHANMMGNNNKQSRTSPAGQNGGIGNITDLLGSTDSSVLAKFLQQNPQLLKDGRQSSDGQTQGNAMSQLRAQQRGANSNNLAGLMQQQQQSQQGRNSLSQDPLNEISGILGASSPTTGDLQRQLNARTAGSGAERRGSGSSVTSNNAASGARGNFSGLGPEAAALLGGQGMDQSRRSSMNDPLMAGLGGDLSNPQLLAGLDFNNGNGGGDQEAVHRYKLQMLERLKRMGNNGASAPGDAFPLEGLDGTGGASMGDAAKALSNKRRSGEGSSAHLNGRGDGTDGALTDATANVGDKRRSSNADPSSNKSRSSSRSSSSAPSSFSGGWQSNADIEDRRQITTAIMEIIKKMRPEANEVNHKLPRMAKKLEEHLYRSAQTRDEYVDRSTLKKRLQRIAQDVGAGGKGGSSNSGSGGGSKHQQQNPLDPSAIGVSPASNTKGSLTALLQQQQQLHAMGGNDVGTTASPALLSQLQGADPAQQRSILKNGLLQRKMGGGDNPGLMNGLQGMGMMDPSNPEGLGLTDLLMQQQGQGVDGQSQDALKNAQLLQLRRNKVGNSQGLDPSLFAGGLGQQADPGGQGIADASRAKSHDRGSLSGEGGSGGNDGDTAKAKKVILQKQQRLFLLRHASKCTLGPACNTKFCPQMVKLWRHVKKCRDKKCPTPHCLSSRYVIHHHRQCKERNQVSTCEVCAPVMKLIKSQEAGQKQSAGQDSAPPPTDGGGGGGKDDDSLMPLPLPGVGNDMPIPIGGMSQGDTTVDPMKLLELRAAQEKLQNLQKQREQHAQLLKLNKPSIQQQQQGSLDTNEMQQLLHLQQQQQLQQQLELLRQPSKTGSSDAPNSPTDAKDEGGEPSSQAGRADGKKRLKRQGSQMTARPAKKQAVGQRSGGKGKRMREATADGDPKLSSADTRAPNEATSSAVMPDASSSSSAQPPEQTSASSVPADTQESTDKSEDATPEQPVSSGSISASVPEESGGSSESKDDADVKPSLVGSAPQAAEDNAAASASVIISLTPRQVREKCEPLVQKLLSQDFGWVFRDPVDPEALALPDYFEVVKEPMNLALVVKRLEDGYYSDVNAFERDTKLVFDNAILYNGANSEVGSLAQSLLRMFAEDFEQLVSGLKNEGSS